MQSPNRQSRRLALLLLALCLTAGAVLAAATMFSHWERADDIRAYATGHVIAGLWSEAQGRQAMEQAHRVMQAGVAKSTLIGLYFFSLLGIWYIRAGRPHSNRVNS